MLLWHCAPWLYSKVITEMDIRSPILLSYTKFLELSTGPNAPHWQVKGFYQGQLSNQLLQITMRFSNILWAWMERGHHEKDCIILGHFRIRRWWSASQFQVNRSEPPNQDFQITHDPVITSLSSICHSFSSWLSSCSVYISCKDNIKFLSVADKISRKGRKLWQGCICGTTCFSGFCPLISMLLASMMLLFRGLRYSIT